jgi:hypothetical protein
MKLTLRLFLIMCLSRHAFGQGEVRFNKQVITTDFISEGVAVGDVNKDGKPDILAGAFWFESPDWKRHEISPGKVYNPETEYSHSFLDQAMDVNRDGWIDLVVIDFPGTKATWYENPKNKEGYWKQYLIYETVGNESPAFVDVDGDGQLDLLCADSKERQMIWLRAGNAKGITTWERYGISEKNSPGTDIFSHGLGYGDINGDRRPDVVTREGWWEGPLDTKQPNWRFHPADIGDECSQMYTLDVNGDGKADVLSASAHLSGIWWHEQGLDEKGETWEQHVISYAFAESHSLTIADLNGDGHPDMITGKRDLHRNTWRKNPGTHGPPLLYWFEFVKTEPYWIAHEIDNGAGAGLNTVAKDMNGDGLIDIVIADFKGVYVFENLMKR